MTDYDRLIAFLKGAGIAHSIMPYSEGSKDVQLDETSSGLFFSFDSKGKFTQAGAEY